MDRDRDMFKLDASFDIHYTDLSSNYPTSLPTSVPTELGTDYVPTELGSITYIIYFGCLTCLIGFCMLKSYMMRWLFQLYNGSVDNQAPDAIGTCIVCNADNLEVLCYFSIL